jgi:hypothetical protein
MEIPRLASPATNPNGYLAAVGAVLAAVVMIYNAVNHRGPVDATVIVSGAGALLALLSRQYVTPVSDPRDGNGNSLAAVPAPLAPVLRTAAGLKSTSDLHAAEDTPPGQP